jgi:hypothetical protein
MKKKHFSSKSRLQALKYENLRYSNERELLRGANAGKENLCSQNGGTLGNADARGSKLLNHCNVNNNKVASISDQL